MVIYIKVNLNKLLDQELFLVLRTTAWIQLIAHLRKLRCCMMGTGNYCEITQKYLERMQKYCKVKTTTTVSLSELHLHPRHTNLYYLLVLLSSNHQAFIFISHMLCTVIEHTHVPGGNSVFYPKIVWLSYQYWKSSNDSSHYFMPFVNEDKWHSNKNGMNQIMKKHNWAKEYFLSLLFSHTQFSGAFIQI